MTRRGCAVSAAVTLLAVCTGACSDARLDAFSALSALPEAGSGGSLSGGRSAGGDAGKAGSAGAARGGTSAAGGRFGTGGSGFGGSSGHGNAGSGSTVVEVLDDFEDGDKRPLTRQGWWYPQGVPDDADMTFSHAPEGSMALHAVSTDESPWSIIGLELITNMGYDATRFSALRFRARAEPGSPTELRVKLLSSDGDGWSTVALTGSWQQYTLPFDLFSALPGSGDMLNEASILHIQFFMFDSAAFDYWLDDIAFIE